MKKWLIPAIAAMCILTLASCKPKDIDTDGDAPIKICPELGRLDTHNVSEFEWVAEKENAINEAAEKWEGGSGEPMARNMAAIHLMEERFTYLVSLLK